MIVVFGSLNMDLVMKVPALPRPGETVLTETYESMPGGKGNNQAVAAARAGGAVRMVGAVGDDGFGLALLANLTENGVDARGVRMVEGSTGVAWICVDRGGENFIAVASGANLKAEAADVPDAWLGPGTTLVMQMEVPHQANWRLAARARTAGARTVLNAAPAAPVPAGVLDDLDVLVVNEIEAATVAAGRGLAPADPVEAARALARASDLTCVVTLGAKGAVAATGEAVWAVDVMPIVPVDTTGAGDAFTGVLAAALDEGLPLPQAMRRAGTAAALACLALGAQESLPTGAAIAEAIERMPQARRIA
jgi:ribokinase